jgi:hypothetical protein
MSARKVWPLEGYPFRATGTSRGAQFNWRHITDLLMGLLAELHLLTGGKTGGPSRASRRRAAPDVTNRLGSTLPAV